MQRAKLNLIFAMIIFGSIGLFVKQISLPSAQVALARGVIGSGILLMAFLLRKQKINWSAVRMNLPVLLGSGLLFGFNWIFLFEAYQYTSIANATLSYYCAPLIVTLLSPLILKERLTGAKIFCVASAMAGMFCIAGGEGAAESNQYLGIAYGLAAACLYAGVVLFNKFLKRLTGLESTFFQLAIASIAILPYVLLSQDLRYTALDLRGGVLLAVVCVVHTGVAFILFFSSLPKLPGQTIALFSYIDPISAIILSSILLRERMGFLQILGGILIIGAALVSEWAGRRRPAKTVTELSRSGV